VVPGVAALFSLVTSVAGLAGHVGSRHLPVRDVVGLRSLLPILAGGKRFPA
jgi:hypothetical protein